MKNIVPFYSGHAALTLRGERMEFTDVAQGEVEVHNVYHKGRPRDTSGFERAKSKRSM
jgi:hypothetical protein